MHCQFCLCDLASEGVRGTSLVLVTAGKGECMPDRTSFLFLWFVWDGDPISISDRLLFAVRQRGFSTCVWVVQTHRGSLLRASCSTSSPGCGGGA